MGRREMRVRALRWMRLSGLKFGIDVRWALPPISWSEMRVNFEVALRACGVAAGLWLARAEAAEPVSPLLGATQEQVLSRYGEPRSQMSAGDRLIFLYPRERVVLRGGVVIEVEAVVPEPVRRPSPVETPPPAGPATSEPPSAPASTGTSPEPGPATPTNPAQTAPGAVAAPVQPAPPPEPKVEIKLVRPPGSKDLPPAPISRPPLSPTTTSPSLGTTAAVEASAEVIGRPDAASLTSTALAEANEARKAAERAAAAEKEQKAKARKEALRRLDEAASSEVSSGGMFSGRTWMIIGAVILAGIALIFWRSRRRPIELAAAAAGNPAPGTGLAPAASAGSGASFTPEMIEELGWKQFERLVVSYYSKTGVVAEPTNAGPEGAVQIKISWKGEPRPFAYVRCVTSSAGVVDVKPLNELGAALAADDIRRGYVVTPGRFTPAARGLAAEKQLTLMSGDVLLEKLNALPTSARKELMREILPS